jgi:hypothetical protein
MSFTWFHQILFSSRIHIVSGIPRCWHLFGTPITQQEPEAVLSGQARTVRGTGPDGPRPGTRLGFPA